ncbi:hypothetical protein B1L11_10800 [Microbispora sp. GKU 823]|nr:condensation domain-containing protein [Microbispora sp. GKU 823]OPG13066.1 hypothetical protein B1L11_10800 [Microbispora sp. GKU 823]
MSTSFEDKLAAVPAHLSELIRRQLAGESAAPAEDRPIRPVPRTAGLPMSSAQQRLWFMAELEPDSAEYNALRALRLRGDLDVEALTVAVNRVVERHESLRTTFDAVDGRGVQIVHEHVDRALPVVDVSGRGSAARVEEFLLREMGSPYDLRGGPLLRVTLLRLGERDHVLVLGAHHIVVDGWSTGNLLAELAAVYTAELCGTPAQLPPLPVQYADYAAWQREREADGTLDGPLAYWRGRLDRMPVLELPADRPRPPVRTPAGAVHEFEVPAELVARLRELGRSNGATLFMVLVAAAKLLLGRYSGERDIAVGTVTSGRGHPDLDHLIGSFINTLVLRSQVDESLSFTAFVRQVRATLLEAYANEEVPFQRLVEALRPERDPSRPPLVQVMVNLQNLADGAPRLPGLEVSEIQPPMNVAKLDLTFDFYEDARSLTCYLEYSTDLYDRATVERLAGHLVTLLGAVAAAPDAPLWTRDILPEAELRDPHRRGARPVLRARPRPPRARAVRRAGRAPAGRLRGELRGRASDVRRAGRRGQPARPAPDRSRCRPRRAGGDLPRTRRGRGRRDAGRAQGRRRLPAARPRAPRAAAGDDAGRRGRLRGDHRAPAARPSRRTRRHARRPRPGPPGARRAARAVPGRRRHPRRPGVRRLHLGIDRQAQGRDGQPPQRAPHHAGLGRALRPEAAARELPVGVQRRGGRVLRRLPAVRDVRRRAAHLPPGGDERPARAGRDAARAGPGDHGHHAVAGQGDLPGARRGRRRPRLAARARRRLRALARRRLPRAARPRRRPHDRRQRLRRDRDDRRLHDLRRTGRADRLRGDRTGRTAHARHPGCTCSTSACARCPWGCSARSTSAAAAWRRGTGTGRT